MGRFPMQCMARIGYILIINHSRQKSDIEQNLHESPDTFKGSVKLFYFGLQWVHGCSKMILHFLSKKKKAFCIQQIGTQFLAVFLGHISKKLSFIQMFSALVCVSKVKKK